MKEKDKGRSNTPQIRRLHNSDRQQQIRQGHTTTHNKENRHDTQNKEKRTASNRTGGSSTPAMAGGTHTTTSGEACTTRTQTTTKQPHDTPEHHPRRKHLTTTKQHHHLTKRPLNRNRDRPTTTQASHHRNHLKPRLPHSHNQDLKPDRNGQAGQNKGTRTERSQGMRTVVRSWRLNTPPRRRSTFWPAGFG